MSDDPIGDVSASSAAYLANLVDDLAKLSVAERFARLELHFRASLMAFRDTQPVRRVADPSNN